MRWAPQRGLVIWILCLLIARACLAQLTVTPPLHTAGREIVDANRHTVRLISVNWYGFDEGEFVAGGLDRVPLNEMVATIRRLGFNSVHLPYANQAVEDDPLVPAYALAANPGLQGKHAMEVMDAVIAALASQHLMVVLDDHVSERFHAGGKQLGIGHDVPLRIAVHRPAVVNHDVLVAGVTHSGSDHMVGGRADEALVHVATEPVPRVPAHRGRGRQQRLLGHHAKAQTRLPDNKEAEESAAKSVHAKLPSTADSNEWLMTMTKII